MDSRVEVQDCSKLVMMMMKGGMMIHKMKCTYCVDHLTYFSILIVVNHYDWYVNKHHAKCACLFLGDLLSSCEGKGGNNASPSCCSC